MANKIVDKTIKVVRISADTRDMFLEKRKENVRDDFYQQVRDSTKPNN